MKSIQTRIGWIQLVLLSALLLSATELTAQSRLGNRVDKFEVWGNQKLQWLTGNGKGYTEGMVVPHAMGARTPLSAGPWTVDFCFESSTSGKWGFIGTAPFNTSIPLTTNPDTAAIVIDATLGPVSFQNALPYAVFGDSLGHKNPLYDTCGPDEHGITVQFTTIDLTKRIFVYIGAMLSKPGDVSGSGVPITAANSSSAKNGNWQGAQYSNGNRTTNIQSPDPFVQLPVELVSFNVMRTKSGYRLDWETASEHNNAGFAIEQSANHGEWTEAGYVEGAGTTQQRSYYTFSVTSDEPGVHRFRLRQIDLDGAFTYGPMVEAVAEIPGTHYLSDTYPNPFNPATSFSLLVAVDQEVRIDVYDILGQVVGTLYDGTLMANVSQQFHVDGSKLSSGVYTIVVRGQNFVDTRKVVLLK